MEQNAEQCPNPLNFSGKFLSGFPELDHICIKVVSVSFIFKGKKKERDISNIVFTSKAD